MPEVVSEIIIPQPPPRVYAVAREVERFPEFLPDVESVVITEREGERVTSEWVGLVREFGRKIKWTEEDRWDEAGLRCDFRTLKGDWDRYEGSWTFEPHPDGCLVRLRLDYDLNVPLIGALIRGLLKKLVQKNSDQMLLGLKARVLGER